MHMQSILHRMRSVHYTNKKKLYIDSIKMKIRLTVDYHRKRNNIQPPLSTWILTTKTNKHDKYV